MAAPVVLRRRLALACALPLLLAALPLAAERPPIAAYGPGHGLAHENVRSLALDEQGLLWLGTALGLARFDGVEFHDYGPEDGLPAGFVHALLPVPGGLWVGTGRGLYHFDTGPRSGDAVGLPRFSPVPLGGGDDSVLTLAPRRAGGLWVGTRTALWAVEREGPARRVVGGRGGGGEADVHAVLERGDGSLWVGGDFGLLAGRDGSDEWRRVPLGAAGRVLALAADGEDGLWVGLDRGLVRLPLGRGAAAVAAAVPHVGDRPVRALHRAADGRLWVGAVGGVHVRDGGRWRTWTVANGLPDETVNAFLEDAAGNLWLGTDLGGLVKWSAEGFVSYGLDEGLGYANSASFFAGAAGDLFVTSSQRAFVQRFDGDRFTAVELALPAPAAAAARRERTPLLLDHAGTWWAGTSHGLFRFPAVERIEDLAGRPPEAVLTRRDGLPSNVVHKLFEDRDGDVWIATSVSGALAVWRRSRGTIEVFAGGAQRIPRAVPTAFAELGDELWVGWSDGTLLARRGGGLAPMGRAPVAISALYTDPSGRLWVGTAGRGMRSWQPGGGGARGRLVDVASPTLRHASVSAITADAAGRLYVGTTGGIFQVDPGTSATRPLGRAAGLPLREVLGAWTDQGGRLWFATLGGVSRLEARTAPPAGAARAWIQRVTVDGETRFAAPSGAGDAGVLRIEPSESQLRVDFVSPSLAAAGGPSVQVRLDRDGEWSPAGSERSVLLADLPPGDHRLTVRALDAAGRAGAPAEVRFEVVPPLWRRAWFLALGATALAAALLLAHRARLSRALEVERVRTRIASDLHDELGASLARVSVLSDVARRQLASSPESSAGLLDEIGATARQLIGTTGDIALSIDPRRCSLASLLARLRRFAGDLLEGSGVRLRLEHAGSDPETVDLAPAQRRHLLAALQEMLHNVVRHAGASVVTITVAAGDRSIEVAIADDGCGVAPAGAAGVGQGLGNVAARAAALGGTATLDSAPGRGTRWTLVVPRRLPRAARHDLA